MDPAGNPGRLTDFARAKLATGMGAINVHDLSVRNERE